MEDSLEGESLASWPTIDKGTFQAISAEYVLFPEEFIVRAAQRLQREQQDIFLQLSRHAVASNSPHASMKWSLLLYESMSRSAEATGTSLPVVTEDQLARLHQQDLNLLGAAHIDDSLVQQTLLERQARQYRVAWQFAKQYGEGAANLVAVFMIHTASEANQGLPSNDYVWILLKTMVSPSQHMPT